VDLPIPGVTPVLADAPQSGVDPVTVFRRPDRVGPASGYEALSQGIEQLAVTAAEQKGREDAMAFARDEKGDLHPVEDRASSFILGHAGKAYQHAFAIGSLAGLQSNIDQQADGMRNEFAHDPEGFKIAWGKYADTIRTNYVGPLGAAAFEHATRVGSQYAIALHEDKRRADMQTAATNIQTRIDGFTNDVISAARNTTSDSPDFITKLPEFAQLSANLDALAVNPDFNQKWTAERVAAEKASIRDQAAMQWILGNAKRKRDAEGIDAAAKWVEENTVGAKSSLSMSQREAALHAGLTQIQTLTQEQEATRRASQAAVHSVIGLYQHGAPPSDEQYQAILDTARRAFNVEGAAQLQAAHDAWLRGVKPYAGLSPVSGASAVMGQGGDINAARAAISGIESGGDYGALGPVLKNGDQAVGKYQVMKSNIPAWTRLALGRELTPEEFRADKDAQEKVFEHQFGGYMRKYGPAGAASMWFTGRPDTPAGAKDALGTTASGYVNKFMAAYQTPGRASPIPFSGEELARNPWLASAAVGQYTADKARMVQFAKDQFELIGQSISMGLPPPVERVAQVMQIAQMHPTELAEASTKMQAGVAASKIALQAAGMPDGGAAYMQEARDLAQSSPDLYHLSFAQALQQQIEGRAKQIAADPHAYAARPEVGWIKKPPMPFEALANPQAVGAQSPAQVMSAAIADRREAGYQIGGRMGLPPASMMFTKRDVASIGSLLQRADGGGASMILRSLEGQLQPAEMQALAGQKEFVNAVGGLARSGDPGKVAAAFGFMDKQYRENPLAFAKDYGKDMVSKMAVWQGKIAFMGPEQAAKELQRQSDPSTQQAYDALHKQAKEQLKDLTPDQVINKVFDGWLSLQPGAPVSDTAASSANAMLQDYRSIYGDIYAQSGDKTLAENEAAKQLQAKWGVSAMNGGRVMAYPPEAQSLYPPDIFGRKDYIKAQLQNDIAELAAKTYQGAGVSPEKLRAAEHVLVSDDRTQEDIANRVPPSYRVLVKDDAGRWVPMMADARAPFRFRADPSIIAAQQERLLIERRQSATVQGAF
jgi:hypothetical protein